MGMLVNSFKYLVVLAAVMLLTIDQWTGFLVDPLMT